MRDYEPYYTEDGSIGLYSYADNDVYHSKYGALTEAWEKFVLPSNIPELIESNRKEIKVLDVCYGIGYNSKALMSYILNKNIKKLKRKNLFTRLKNFVSICVNNLQGKGDYLSSHIDTVYEDKNHDNLPQVNIDCMDINEELVKLSPFFKTIKTPEEIYSKIVPDIFSCFQLYYLIRRLFVSFASLFYPKNRKEIKDLLDIKFKNMHIDKEYKVNNFVNYIIINSLSKIYGKEYLTKDIKKIIRERRTSKFLEKSLIKYAKFNQFWGYNSSSKVDLSTFLHNIYYGSISRRYKNIDFKAAQSIFKLNFYINDARKSILSIKNVYDCIFLDAFTYTKSPNLWSVEFIRELTNHLSEKGVILTYSNSAQIRNTFLENNLYVGKIFNKKENKFVGTIASKDKLKIKYPLNNYEIGLCNTKAGIPYHDPNLAYTNKEILELREYEFKHSNLISSSKYMKIRSLRGNNEDEDV